MTNEPCAGKWECQAHHHSQVMRCFNYSMSVWISLHFPWQPKQPSSKSIQLSQRIDTVSLRVAETTVLALLKMQP